MLDLIVQLEFGKENLPMTVFEVPAGETGVGADFATKISLKLLTERRGIV